MLSLGDRVRVRSIFDPDAYYPHPREVIQLEDRRLDGKPTCPMPPSIAGCRDLHTGQVDIFSISRLERISADA